LTKPNPFHRVALIGDYHPSVTAHICAPRAIALAAQEVGSSVSACWVETDWLASVGVEEVVGSFDAIWCVPASPYADQNAVVDAIRYARKNDVPFLGTCGGFQHAVIEFFRTELTTPDANSTEDAPDTASPVIDALACALREVDSKIELVEGSRLAEIYEALSISETYNCGFGFNPAFEALLENADLQVCGRDTSPKAVEIKDHRFFIATAFQPERSALNERSHPLIEAFVASMGS